jgi:hypothetical protein
MFAFKFTLRCLQPDIVPIICHQYEQHQLYQRQNLPPVALIPVVHLDLRREFSKKFEMTLMLFSAAWWKKPEAKNLVTLYLY